MVLFWSCSRRVVCPYARVAAHKRANIQADTSFIITLRKSRFAEPSKVPQKSRRVIRCREKAKWLDARTVSDHENSCRCDPDHRPQLCAGDPMPECACAKATVSHIGIA